MPTQGRTVNRKVETPNTGSNGPTSVQPTQRNVGQPDTESVEPSGPIGARKSKTGPQLIISKFQTTILAVLHGDVN